MDWRLFASTFATIFLAELGDKTQFATLSLSVSARAPWTVFLASALALAATSAVAVLAGGYLTRFISPLWMARIAGGILVVMGLWTLWSAGRGE